MNSLAQSPFRGRFEVKLDPKGRLSLPPNYRNALVGSAAGSSTGGELVVTNSRYRSRSCLDVYSMREWEKLEDRIAKLSSLRPEVQAFNRFYLSGGQPVEVDSQNRLLIPQSLRRYAGLESEVVLIGLNSKFEIWSSETWNEIHLQLSDSFEQTMAAVAELEKESER